MDKNEINNRFRFHPASTESRQHAHELVRNQCGTLARILNDELPEGREKSTVMTKLEEVMFWANAAIARQPNGE